jgi:hypothetical protein
MAAASDARFTHIIAKARTVFIRACLRPRATTGNGPASVFFLLTGMTAIGAEPTVGAATKPYSRQPPASPAVRNSCIVDDFGFFCAVAIVVGSSIISPRQSGHGVISVKS